MTTLLRDKEAVHVYYHIMCVLLVNKAHCLISYANHNLQWIRSWIPLKILTTQVGDVEIMTLYKGSSYYNGDCTMQNLITTAQEYDHGCKCTHTMYAHTHHLIQKNNTIYDWTFTDCVLYNKARVYYIKWQSFVVSNSHFTCTKFNVHVCLLGSHTRYGTMYMIDHEH